MDPSNFTAFRIAEREYKSRTGQTDLSKLVDFNNCNHLIENGSVIEIKGAEMVPSDTFTGGLISVFQLRDAPGITVIRNPFRIDAQRKFIHSALSDYSQKPNISNLDLHWQIPTDQGGLFGYWEKQQRSGTDMRIYKKSIDGESGHSSTQYGGNEENDDKENEENHLPADRLIRKLRWVTLGRQYDWNTKLYSVHEFPFPDDLAEISRVLLEAIGPYIEVCCGAVGAGADMEDDKPEEYAKRRLEHKGDPLISHDIIQQSSTVEQPVIRVGYDKPYYAEAGIVNYYQLRDKLTGHVDRSEVNLEAPLVSLSFGHSCVFLAGGPTRNTEPVAIRIDSGDVLIMSGLARRCFHGVPRILEGSLPEYLMDYRHGEDGCGLCSSFISTARINMNVRQIFYHDY